MRFVFSAARQLEKNKTGIKIIGFDIGITDQGDIWIIEGNDTPRPLYVL